MTKTLALRPNLASAKCGAKVLASSPGSLNAAALIDDTEATNWAGVNDADSVDTTSPFVSVDLAGSRGPQDQHRARIGDAAPRACRNDRRTAARGR